MDRKQKYTSKEIKQCIVDMRGTMDELKIAMMLISHNIEDVKYDVEKIKNIIESYDS